MEKQYSEEFFCTFVDNLQKLCRNFLDFEQVCEVSGYVCLMMDNSKQERYVLSEMVHNSGSVISESYCTKAFRTLPLMRNAPHPRKHYERDFSPGFDDEDYESSMDSCTHSSMDSFSGEVPHGLTISNVQSLSASPKGQAGALNLNTRNPTQMTKLKCPEKTGVPSDKSLLMKSEPCAESDSKNMDKKRAISPRVQNIVIKQEICEEEEDAYEHGMKSGPVTSTSHKEQLFPHQRPPVQHRPPQPSPVQHSPPVHRGPPLKHGPVQHRPPLHHGPSVKHGSPIHHGPPMEHDSPMHHGPPRHHGRPMQHDPPVHRGHHVQHGTRVKHSPRMHRGPAQHHFVQHDPNPEIHEMEAGLVQIKQEPEDSEFIPNVEINSSISDLNILKDEFLIAEPIGYLKPKESPQRTGPKTKRTARKVYVPLSTASRPEGNVAIQPRKYLKLEQSHPSDDGRVAQHSPEHYHDEEHSGSESEDFMYDSMNDSMNDSYSDMEDYQSYSPDQMMHGHPDMHVERRHAFTSRQMDQDIGQTPSRSQSFTPSHTSERDSSSLPVERHQPCTSVQKGESSNLPPDGQPTKALGHDEKDSANTPVEQGTELPSDKHVTASSQSEEDNSNLIQTDKQPADVAGHSEQASDHHPDAEDAVTPGPEKESPNMSVEKRDVSNQIDQGIVAGSKGEKEIAKLSIEREDTYTSSHMQQGIAIRAAASSNQGEKDNIKKSVDKQDILNTSNVEKNTGLKATDTAQESEQDNPNLTLEGEDAYTSSFMEKGIGMRAGVTSGCSEKDSSHVSIEREDTYISSHMEKGIAMRAAVASCHEEEDDDGPNLAIEREDVYTSSHMARGIAMRAAVMSGHVEKEKPVLAVERQDTYTSHRMKQGIALRAAIAAGHCEEDLDSHDMYDPHYMDASDSHHMFVSSQMEQSLASLPTDSVTTMASGHVIKAPSSLSNISLMEESGDEIIELDSDDIEEDEGLAAATASLSQQSFSQSQPSVPSTSSQGSIMAREPQRHMQNAINLFSEYQRQQGCMDPMHLLPPQKLDLLLAGFFENIKKTKAGEDFTPFSLKNIQNRLQKHLHEQNYPYSITSDSAFVKSREVLRLRIEELKCRVRNVPQKVDMVTDEDVEILFQKNQLGASSPDTLFNTMWFINTMFLGIKSRIEHCNLRWGDIVLNIDHTGREFLRYAGPKQNVKNRAKPLFANTDDPDRCFVELYKIYEDRRPPELLMADAPFYCTVIKFPTGEPWFLPEPTPSARFNGILQKMAKEAGLAPRKKFTNSSSYVK